MGVRDQLKPVVLDEVYEAEKTIIGRREVEPDVCYPPALLRKVTVAEDELLRTRKLPKYVEQSINLVT